MNEEMLLFPDREAFRRWLGEHPAHEGVWLIFSKDKKLKTLSAAHALEEALCFGWIDGQIDSLDEQKYRKYFSPRRSTSKWSDKNRKLAQKLIDSGLMTEYGFKAIEAAKAAGTFETEPAKRLTIGAEHVQALMQLLTPYEAALANYQKMTPSAQKAYAGSYFSLSTEAGRGKKLLQLKERLELNLDPMQSLAKHLAQNPREE